MKTIQVSIKALKAASRVSASNDIRYFLNSVYVEASPKETICVATDGHHMTAIRRAAENDVGETVTIIIPIEVIKILTKGRRKNDRHMIDLVLDGEKWTAPLPEYGNIQFTGLEANYPVWRKVTPTKTSGEASNYNVRLLRNLQDAAADLGATGRFPVTVSQNGEGAALVTCNGISEFEMVGLIMPCRAESSGTAKAPEWAVLAEQAEEAVETES